MTCIAMIILLVKLLPSGATKLYDSDFYVVNSQYQVYKCIYNGTSSSDPNGKPSTVKVTGTSTSIITTGDGYRWKYLYTIPVASVLKFSLMIIYLSLPMMR